MTNLLPMDLYAFHGSRVANYDAYLVSKTLGFSLNEQEIAGLAGAPSGSVLTIAEEPYERHVLAALGDPSWTDEIVPHGLRITIEHKKYISSNNSVILTPVETFEGTLRFSIYIALVMFYSRSACPDMPDKMGARMIRSIVSAADAVATNQNVAQSIELFAAGGRQWGPMVNGQRWAGYAVWPKCGFDMRLNSNIHGPILQLFPKYPPNLSACRSVRDVLNLPGGENFWSVGGDGKRMSFDLAANSRHRRVLDDYLGEIK